MTSGIDTRKGRPLQTSSRGAVDSHRAATLTATNTASLSFADRAEQFLSLLVYGALIAIPIVFSVAGNDSFRLPKVLWLRAFGIVAIATMAAAALSSDGSRLVEFLRSRVETRLAAAVVVWCALTCLWSDNRRLSLNTFWNVLFAAALFVAALYVMRRGNHRWLGVAIAVAASVNSVVMILEEARIWHPFGNLEYGHPANGALLGNPNDVGMFLCPAAMALLIMAWVNKGRARLFYGLTGLLAFAGLVASATTTAMLAFALGMAAFLLVAFRRNAFVALGVAAVVALVAVFAYPPLRARADLIRQHTSTLEFNRLLGGRVSAAATALEIVRKHPIGGSGLGTFEWNYVEYRLLAEQRYPKATAWPPDMGGRVMFGETHNDHLQIAAETGLVGYLLFLAAVALVATSYGRAPRDEADVETSARMSFTRAAAVPLAVVIVVLPLGQFPLQLAAPSLLLLALAAAVRTGSHAHS